MSDPELKEAPPAIRIENLRKSFHRRGQPTIRAIDDVSLQVTEAKTLGIVGESGSGKSTVARCILGLIAADSGRVTILGRDVTGASAKDLRAWRRDMQIVFQEPDEALDPHLRIGAAIAEPLVIHTDLDAQARRARVEELLTLVQLHPGLYDRLPRELSLGQQQRVNIARALATHPKVIVLDEPTSSLDVSVRAEILKLLVRLQRELQLTYVLISHDLPTIRHVCDTVAVMYLGRLVEIGPAERVLHEPAHPYTGFLLGSELSIDPDAEPTMPPVRGEARPSHRGTGCVFADRCPKRIERCDVEQPPLRADGPQHFAACIWAGDAVDETAQLEGVS